MELSLTRSLQPGTVITIQGSIPFNSKRFTVNLESTMSYHENDVVFHFDTRFEGGKVVRNTKANCEWGSEEVDVPEGTLALPFLKGRDFQIAILVQHHQFKVAVNNNHFINYSHRLSYKIVDLIRIKGVVLIRHLTSSVQKNDPDFPKNSTCQHFNLEVPFNMEIPGGLLEGNQICLTGKPTSNASRFEIRLVNGAYELVKLTISFHVEVNDHFDFHEEDRGYVNSSFVRDQFCDIAISSLNCGFLIAVNGDPFSFYGRPRTMKDAVPYHLEILGDLHVYYMAVTPCAHASRTYYCNGHITACD